MAKDTQRLIWVDVVKVFAIILVVIGHVWRGMEEASLIQDEALFTSLDNAIYYFHMPLFFMISGFLFQSTYQRDWLTTLKRQAIFIVWPYILWSVVIVSIKIILSSSVNSESSFGSLLNIYYEPVSIFWFLYVLFLSQIFVKLIFERIRSSLFLLLSGIAFLLAHYIFDLSAVTILDLAAKFAVFFIVGFCLSQQGFVQNLKVKASGAVMALLIFMAVQALYFLDNVSLDSVWTSVAGLVLSLSFTAIFMHLSEREIFKSPIFTYIGLATMAIYVSHVVFTAGMRIVLAKLNIDDVTLHVLGGTMLGLICPLVMYEISQRLKLTTLSGLGVTRRAKS